MITACGRTSNFSGDVTWEVKPTAIIEAAPEARRDSVPILWEADLNSQVFTAGAGDCVTGMPPMMTPAPSGVLPPPGVIFETRMCSCPPAL